MAKIDIELPNGQRAGETLKQLTNQAAALRKELGGLKPGTEEFVKSAASLNQVDAKMGSIKSQIKDTTAASNSLKQSFGGILNQIPGFSAISGALNSAKGGVGGLTSGFGLLRGAIIATGLGALVIAIGGVVSWFSKTEKGANVLSGAFKGMGAVIDTLMNRLWNIGDTLKQLFSDPIQFFKNLGKDIKEAAVTGNDLVQVFDDIEDRQRLLDVQSKQQENQVDKLLLQAKNVANTYNQKIELLKQADKITRDSYKVQLELSREYLAAVEREVMADLKQQGFAIDTKKDLLLQDALRGEMADKLAAARTKVLDLEGQEIGMLQKIENRTDQVLGKKEANAKKELKIEEDKIASIEQVNDKADKKEDIKIEDKHQAKLKQAEFDLAVDQNILNEQFLSKEITEQQFAQRSADNLLAYHQKKLIIIKEQFGIESLEYQNEYAKILDLQKAAAAQSIEVTKWLATDGGKALTGSLSTFGNAFQQIASMHEQGTQSWKTFAIAAATISAIQGAINAYASTAAIPVVGTALAPIAGGVALAAGMFNVAKIKSIKQPSLTKDVKAASGGVFRGPSHAQGGIPIEVEGDEIIMTKGVFRNPALRSLASAINVAGGGRQFAAGGPTNPFENNRGPISSVNRSTGDDPLSRLEAKFEMYAKAAAVQAAETSKRIDRITVTNNLQDTEKGLKTLNKLRHEANV